MLVLLRTTLEQLQEKDTALIFAQPVDIQEVRRLNAGAFVAAALLFLFFLFKCFFK